MIDILWLSVGVAIGIVPSAVILILSPRKRKKVNSFDSDNISELIGKIQHVTSVNVDTVERKITELRSAVHEANVAYMKISEVISEMKNLSVNISGSNNIQIRNKEQNLQTQFEKMKIGSSLTREPTIRHLSKEEKILDLKERGWSVEKIAESLDIGIGEVSLVVEMNSRLLK